MHDQSKKNEKLIKKTIYLSNFVAIILFIMKYFNFTITHSHAIYASALDSFVDMISSLINLLTVNCMFLKNNKLLSKGLDKISPFVCLLQSLFVMFFSSILVKESIENILNKHSEAEHLTVGIPIILISILINIALVSYQKNIINKTNSMLIKTDMIHFSSDIISHIALLFGVILMKFTNFFWLDSLIAIILAIYIFIAIFFIIRQSLFSIFDLNFYEKANIIKNILCENNYKIDKVYIYFSGIKYTIEIFNVKEIDQENIRNIIINSKNLPFLSSGCGCHSHLSEFKILFIND